MRRLLGTLLICLEIWVPAVMLSWPVYRAKPARADQFLDRARQGQALGRGLVPNPEGLATQDGAGNLILNWGGNATVIRPQDLFPDMNNAPNPNAGDLSGSEAGIQGLTNSQVQNLRTSNSYTGQAYRVLTGSTNRARVNMSQDPIWARTDQAIQQAVSGELAECHTQYVQLAGQSTAHVPDYRTCERVVYPTGGVCNLYHDYSVAIRTELGLTVAAWTNDDANLQVDLRVPELLACYGAHGVSGCTIAGEPVDQEAVCAAVSEGVIKVLNGTTSSYYAGIGPQPTCENNLTTTVYVHNTPGSHAWEYRTASFVWKVVHIIDRGWTADPGCEALLTNPDGDSIIRPTSYECTLGPCETAATINGAWIEQSHLYAANPLASKGISNLARKVTVQLEPFNTGQMDCWTDPNGVEHCPENTGDRADTCGELESNPACAYVRQECIQGARDPESGACYAWTLVYDCGFDTTLGTGATSTLALVCDGVIRCLGTECIEGQFDEGSQDFAHAAAMLQAVQYVSADTDCSDASAGGCEIFKGRDYDCKKALGGWVDCCVQPQGVSLVDYIKLLGGMYSMASANWTITAFGPAISNPFHGVYDALTDAWDYTSRMFTSAWDSITGTTSEVASQAAGQTITQSLMKAAYNWMSENFPSMAEEIFTATFQDGVLTSVQFAPWLSTALNFIQFAMWIYTIYNVLDILVHIIWACEEEEFELGAKRQLKVCHYVGSFCKTRVVGVCIEKRDSYCCFNSPLSRILQEQVRGQLGRGWGNPDEPDCSGLRASELAQVDWNRVDLSEWLALLSIAGEMPTQHSLDLAGLTGAGSQFAFDGQITRPDAAQRTIERLGVYQDQTGQELEQLRINRNLRQWGTVGQQP